jgi:virginiamycin B lyase
LWVTVVKAHTIYSVTPDGKFIAFPTSETTLASFITAGPDGNLWFTEPNGKIGKMSPAGEITEYVVSDPYTHAVEADKK